MISANSLFHFTNDYTTLLNILEIGFYPNYSLENLGVFSVEEECVGIPMVSFCDMPLSYTKNHTKIYGCYGFGLSKKWGMLKNICPIHYIYPDSICSRVIENIYGTLAVPCFRPNCTCFDFELSTAIFYYIKPYKGKLMGRGDHISSISFYDEREWRYIPFADNTVKGNENKPTEIDSMLSYKDWNTPEIRERKNKKLHEKYQLRFSPDDIRYIIIKEESEMSPIIDGIYKLQKFNNKQKRELTTRIISMEKIRADFG